MTISRIASYLALLSLVAAAPASALPTLDRDECIPLESQSESGLGIVLDSVVWTDEGRSELAFGLPRFDKSDPHLEDAGRYRVLLRQDGDPAEWVVHSGIQGNAAGAAFGAALDAGDFDGDGELEFAVGAPGAGGGQVFILAISGILPFVLGQDALDVAGAAEANDFFGSAVAVGNFDGDEYDDLAVGVYGETWSEAAGDHHGAVHVFYGSETGLDGARDLLFGQHSFGEPREDADYFGRVLAAGNLDGDGHDDLVVGVPQEDEGTLVDSGMVHVVFGSSSGLDFERQQTWSQSSPDVSGGAEAGDRFGASLAIGSFDGVVFEPDHGDLAIGVPGEAEGAVPGAGAVHVLFSDADGPDALGSQFFLRPGGPLHDSDFGLSLHAADLDRDGAEDLLIGSEIVSVAPSGFEEEGEYYLYFGRLSQGMVFSGRRPWMAPENACAETGSRAHEMDSAVTTGDFDGDGELDLAFGFGEWYPEALADSQAAAVVLYGALFADGFDTGGTERWALPEIGFP